MKVIFYSSKKPVDKLVTLIKCAKIHFEKQKPLIFFVTDQEGEQFLDQLLWQNAAFLPHIVSNDTSDELILISRKKELLNNAKYIFNLTSEPLNIPNFQIIYEFDDKADFKKKMLSKKKFTFYHNLKVQIEAK